MKFLYYLILLINIQTHFLISSCDTLLYTSSKLPQYRSIKKVNNKYKNLYLTWKKQLTINIKNIKKCLSFWKKQQSTLKENKLQHKINNTILDLENLLSQEASKLGYIHILQYELNIIIDIYTLQQHAKKSVHIFNTHFDMNEEKIKSKDIKKIKTLIIKQQVLIKKYQANIEQKLQIYQKPAWLKRNLKKIGIGAIGLIAIGLLTYNTNNQIHAWYSTGIKALKNFFDQHILNPLLAIKESILNEKNEIFISQQNFKNKKKSTKKGLEKYLSQWHKELDQDQRTIEIKKIIDEDNDHLITKDFSKHWSSPFITTMKLKMGGAFEASTILYNIKDLQIEKNKLKISNALQLILPLISLGPAYLTTKYVYRAGKKIYSILKIRNIIKEPILKTIIHIEKILNHNQHLGKNLTEESLGFFIYYVEKIKQYIFNIPKQFKQDFLYDIQELESIEMTILQKLRTIDRMYRIYPFLTFSKTI